MFTVTYNDGKSVTTEEEVPNLTGVRQIANKLGIKSWMWSEANEYYGYATTGIHEAVFIEYEGSAE